MDLVINIVYIFFAFSNFSSFHETMTEYKMGDMVLKVIELEVKRSAHRVEQAQKRNVSLPLSLSLSRSLARSLLLPPPLPLSLALSFAPSPSLSLWK